ncbi:HAD family hydrolase [Candidatus Woesearchaeota archaeon]|nr:HAD family hydrolase [Candidatus Woesearchaeota archaeon]
MVKAILFDFWGTLVEQGVHSPIKQVKNILNLRMPFPEYVVRFEKAMMTKPFQDLKEAFQSVGTEFQIKISERQMEELIGMWNKSWMLAAAYAESEEVLIKLKENYQLILISNTDCFSVQKVLEKLHWQDLFNVIYLSYEVKMIKTESNFLTNIIHQLKLNADDCLVVGDSIQSDILPAKRIGMKAVLIDRKNHLNFDPKIRSLNELPPFLSYENTD